MRILLGLADRIFIYHPLTIVSVAAVFILAVTLIILIKKPQGKWGKFCIFWILALPIIGVTFYLAAGTISKNLASATKGPVHWHADFRMFKCGKEIDLTDPSGLSNRIGTPEIHEHGDKRIHIEGTILEFKEASLYGFMEAIGGVLSQTELAIPTNEGTVRMRNGERCPDGNEGALQVFVWKTEDETARQQKLDNFVNYVMAPEVLIPPGDCIIFEFTSRDKKRTDFICEQYEVAKTRGDITIIR